MVNNNSLTISFYTQGCRLNKSETAGIEQQFQTLGFSIIPFKEGADIVVINTCTVTENGDSDARRLVHKAKRMNPSVKIALVGCMAQIQQERLLEWDNVSWVIGNAKKMALPELIKKHPDFLVMTPKMTRETFSVPTPSIDIKHTRATIKIQDGCDFYCSFCVIPFARGPARSRLFTDIIKEVEVLLHAGYKEIVLTGINIGTYTEDGKTILDIIKVLEAYPKLARIRLSSIEPTTIPEALITHMAKSEKLCSYLHIPLQHGEDSMLNKMARKYNLGEFDRFIHFAHDRVPNLCIGTDVIVGFPGETEAQFNAMIDYLKRAPIDYFHVFSYSERKFARSKKIDGKIPSQVISKRSATLRELSQRKKELFFTEHLGTEVFVLFETKKKGFWRGLTDHYIRVLVASDKDLKNSIQPVILKRIEDDFVVAELL